MSSSLSLAARALIALVFMAGFYLLAFAIAAGLLYLPYAELVYAERINLRLVLFQLEAQLTASWLNPGTPSLKPINWAETGGAVMRPYWRDLTERSAKTLEGLTLEDLYKTASDLDPFARRLDVWRSGIPWDTVRQFASSVLGAAFACGLDSHGWAIRNNPGELWLTRDELKINPFQIVGRIASGELKEQEWSESIATFGLDPAMPLWRESANP